jgi:acyl-CoA thioesterase
MRPVPVAPLTVETEILREGRKIQLVAVRLLAGDKEVVRATALRIRKEERALPVERPFPALDLPPPEGAEDALGGAMSTTPFLAGLEMRSARGAFNRPGPASIWYRASRRIVEGAAISPLMRAIIAADFCNGTSAFLSFKHWTFINADLTLSLAREPVGEWILLDAETWAGPDSVGIAAARLADRDGYFGRAVQSVLFEKRA